MSELFNSVISPNDNDFKADGSKTIISYVIDFLISHKEDRKLSLLESEEICFNLFLNYFKINDVKCINNVLDTRTISTYQEMLLDDFFEHRINDITGLSYMDIMRLTPYDYIDLIDGVKKLKSRYEARMMEERLINEIPSVG